MIPNFSDISVTEPDLDTLSKTYSALRDTLSNPSADPNPALQEWDELRRTTATWIHLTELRFNQDTTNEEFVRQQKRCDELMPQLTELDINLKKLILEGPHRETLEQELGQQAFAIWKSETLAFDPAIKDDLVEESRLTSEYNSLLSSAKLSFNGETLNHEGIDKFKFDPDRNVRHAALQVKWQWFDENAEQLDQLFDQIVKCRHKMAVQLGFSDYRELGYLNRCRVDYGLSDVENYRNQVKDVVVPFCERLITQKKETLGLEQVMFWDESVHSNQGNPTPNGDHDWMMERATEMFWNISDSMGAFFEMMTSKELLDLKNREGKGGGGFCTDLPEYGLPFIFANFNGTADDVRVFTHEVGHAFQGFCSREQKIYDYVWPTYESCEIHSMGLEFMTFPHMEKFFGTTANQFCREHVIDSFLFFPYGVAVDHFQHLVYESPQASPAERHQMWKEMEATYLPWRDHGDLPYLPQGGRWQLQRHIFMYPFYYIDYTLALACALQLWKKSCSDFGSTLKEYESLCQKGGTLPFQQLTQSAQLKSPFEAGVLAESVAFAEQFLEPVSKPSID